MIAQLQHSLWLANTILSAGRITRAEIDRRWAYSSLNDRHESFINERTFHRWRISAESILGILIECDRHAGYTYYVPNSEAIRKDQSKRWLLDSFAMTGLVRDEDMHPYVLLEEMPSDSQYLTPIMDALRNRRVLSVRYQRFDAPEGRTFTMQTYCVKSFERRWYMIGLTRFAFMPWTVSCLCRFWIKRTPFRRTLTDEPISRTTMVSLGVMSNQHVSSLRSISKKPNTSALYPFITHRRNCQRQDKRVSSSISSLQRLILFRSCVPSEQT